MHPSVEVYRILAQYINHYVIEFVMEYATKNLWEYDVELLMSDDCYETQTWNTPKQTPLGFYFYHPLYCAVNELEEEAQEPQETSGMYIHINYKSCSEIFYIKESNIPSITRYLKRIPYFIPHLDVQ